MRTLRGRGRLESSKLVHYTWDPVSQKSHSRTEKMAQQLGIGPYFRGPRLKSQDPYDSSQPSIISVLDGKPFLALRHCMHMLQTYAGKTPIHIKTQPQTNILYLQENRDQKNTKWTLSISAELQFFKYAVTSYIFRGMSGKDSHVPAVTNSQSLILQFTSKLYRRMCLGKVNTTFWGRTDIFPRIKNSRLNTNIKLT